MFNALKIILILFIVLFGIIGLNFLFKKERGYDKAEQLRLSADISSASRTKICLNMIVKNESHIIERCLNSVKNIVDCISICDTGSNDHTIGIIEQFMRDHHIPGKIHRHTWTDFGHNRTLSFQVAQHTLQELGFSLSNTYLLLIDADMVLDIDSSFNKDKLTADAYYIRQRNNHESCYNVRLIQASLPWECIGVTHEYWFCKKPATDKSLKSLQILDYEDGGCKADKYERDIKLLTEGLKQDPHNSRYMFYLAQSYMALKNFKEAIKWYQERITMEGWKEEVWYSKLMIGKIYEELGSWTQAFHYYLDAYAYNPKQAEPLYRLATYYRSKGQNHLAYLFAKQGLRIPYPDDSLMFVSHPVYDYQLDEEMSIAAYYTPFKEEGFAAINRLILKKDIPLQTKDLALRNVLYYVQNLRDARFESTEFSEISPATFETQKKNHMALFIVAPCYDFSRFHSHITPIEFENGFLTLVHEVIKVDKQEYHVHRFVFLDTSWNVKKLSKPFIFRHKGLEYCAGITMNTLGTQCVFPIRIEDRENWLCSVPRNTIHSLLEPLPSYSGHFDDK